MNLATKHQEAETLITEFKSMRTLQKAYFKTRFDDPSKAAQILEKSKLQEKKVDKMIDDYFNIQQKMF